MSSLNISFKIEADTKGLTKLARQIRKDGKKVAMKVAFLGAREARSAFGGEVFCQASKTAEGAKVVANGSQVSFLEFGAGQTTDSHLSPPFAVAPGSYSQTVGKKQFLPGVRERWYHKKVRYTRIQPRMGMLRASIAMRRELKQIASKVMGNG